MLKATFIFFVFCTSGCVSAGLKIQSTPEKSKVSVSFDGQPAVNIGETPLEVDPKLLASSHSEFARFYISKEGFQTESMVLPSTSLPSQSSITVKLTELVADKACSDSQAAIQKIARGVARAQLLMMQKNFVQAETTLISLIEDFPNVSVVHDLLGNVYYLKKDLDRALASYKQAKRLDPNSVDTNSMIDKIQAIRSGDRISTGGQ